MAYDIIPGMAEYIKDFDSWNEAKKDCEFSNQKRQFFHTGEIWWCAVGVNIGHEIDGKNDNFERPVLIIKQCNSHLFIGVPLTSKNKVGSFFIPIKYENKVGNAVIVQARTMSASRLLRHMCNLEKSQLEKVKRAYKKFLG
jgi:mRNA interferase MazF